MAILLCAFLVSCGELGQHRRLQAGQDIHDQLSPLPQACACACPACAAPGSEIKTGESSTSQCSGRSLCPAPVRGAQLALSTQSHRAGPHRALRGTCSVFTLRRPQRQPSPTSAFIGTAREPCPAARGLPAQLVRVMRASTTLPMCSRRLRSAAARDISISVICRETATARAASAGPPGRVGTRGHRTGLRTGVHRPPPGVPFHTQDLGRVTACLGSCPYSQSALDPPS